MTRNETYIRVRYGETDQMNVVYHANYACYFDVGRTEWLRAQGFSYKRMEEEGILLPVVSLNISYTKSAFYDEQLKVVTSLKKTPTASIEFEYQLFNEQDQLLATGYTKLAFINKDTNRPTRCPKYLLEALRTQD